MSKALAGIFEEPTDSRKAIDMLVERGVAGTRISVLAVEPTVHKSLGVEKHTKGAEGTAVGGTIGAATVAILAGLTSIGTIATGGIGLFVAGPLIAALAGAGVGAIGGGILGGLIGLGFSEHEVKEFESALEKGSVVIAVDMEDADDEDTVKHVMKQNNASKVSSV